MRIDLARLRCRRDRRCCGQLQCNATEQSAANAVCRQPTHRLARSATMPPCWPRARQQAKKRSSCMHDRHENMEKIGKATKAISRELKGASPDLATVRKTAAIIAGFAPKSRRWFPAGTGPDVGKTEAKAEIWQKPQDFMPPSRRHSSRPRPAFQTRPRERLTSAAINAALRATSARPARRATTGYRAEHKKSLAGATVKAASGTCRLGCSTGCLSALIGFSWWAAEEMTSSSSTSGRAIAILTLLLFRLLWGLFGSSTARFSTSSAGRAAVLGYPSRQHELARGRAYAARRAERRRFARR